MVNNDDTTINFQMIQRARRYNGDRYLPVWYDTQAGGDGTEDMIHLPIII